MPSLNHRQAFPPTNSLKLQMKMTNNSLSSSSDFTWLVCDDIELSRMHSPRASSIYSEQYSTKSDGTVILGGPGMTTPLTPVTPTTPAKVPETSGGVSPEVRHKIENASPETARHVALRMYKSLKRHGLQDEVGKAFERESTEIEEPEEEAVDGARKKREELLGMEYMLRDGFVSYLRDMARITPPIPQQVA